jgi:hypothetical protein
MNCKHAYSLFSLYLDGALAGAQMHSVSSHLETCATCAQQYRSLRQTQSMVASLGRKSAPTDLALKIKVAISQERSMSFGRRMAGLRVRFENLLNAFLMPATAGLVSAVLVFGVLIGSFAIPSVPSLNDVPTLLYTPPKVAAVPFSDSLGRIKSKEPVVIEVYVDTRGRLQNYRIVAGEDTHDVRQQLDRSLIFTQFEPATSFGEPAEGHVVMTFDNVDVRG